MILSNSPKIKSRFFSRRAVTLVELTIVLVILGILGAISYPSMTNFYYTRQATSACLEIMSCLNTARSMSIAGVEGKRYGVIFFREQQNQEYLRTRLSIYSMAPGNAALNEDDFKQAFDGATNAKLVAYGEKVALPQSVDLKIESGDNCFGVFFMDDGIPTHNGIEIPIVKGDRINVSSNNVAFAQTLKISKSTGHVSVE